MESWQMSVQSRFTSRRRCRGNRRRHTRLLPLQLRERFFRSKITLTVWLLIELCTVGPGGGCCHFSDSTDTCSGLFSSGVCSTCLVRMWSAWRRTWRPSSKVTSTTVSASCKDLPGSYFGPGPKLDTNTGSPCLMSHCPVCLSCAPFCAVCRLLTLPSKSWSVAE